MEYPKIAITICATEKYTYAMINQARRVAAALDGFSGHIILAGDEGNGLKEVEDYYKNILLRDKWQVHRLSFKNLKDDHKNYENRAQLLIAQLRTAAFTKARSLDVDYCWSLDSDVLPRSNALLCMYQSLQFDNGYYSISTCPYPSQGGGGFLGGRGTIYQPICPNFYDEERHIPEEIKKEVEQIKKELGALHPRSEEGFKRAEELTRELKEVNKKIDQCQPDGNVFVVNGKHGWKMRGWFDFAYPGLGIGAIVPLDWCGFGCNLLNKKALATAHFDGYEGAGTEDLYIVWHRWYQEGLRINGIGHCPADHVIRNPGKEGNYILQHTYHETELPYIGHLRIANRPFYTLKPGEHYDKENRGLIIHPPQPKNTIEEKKINQEVKEKPKIKIPFNK